MLDQLPPRVFLREAFETPPGEGGLFRGDLEGGLAISRGQDSGIAFRHLAPLGVPNRGNLRMRLRAHNVRFLEIEMRVVDDAEGYLLSFPPEVLDEWHVFEVPLGDIPRREDPGVFLEPGLELTDFRLDMMFADPGCVLEVDWVEFVIPRGVLPETQ